MILSCTAPNQETIL